jgi:acyl carrier protein
MLRTLSRFLPRFSTEVQKSTAKPSSSGLTYYKDGQLVNRTSLTLKKQEDIESYVIKTVQNYFRTTYKQGNTLSYSGVNKSSTLAEHGLDSLDAIEISMQIEEDLGYTISAETLPSFTKVKHYITYIEQVEAFKHENSKSPIA